MRKMDLLLPNEETKTAEPTSISARTASWLSCSQVEGEAGEPGEAYLR